MRILRSPEVENRIGLSRVQIWRLERAGKFPSRIKISANAIGWIESEVDAWIEARAAERDDTDAAAQ